MDSGGEREEGGWMEDGGEREERGWMDSGGEREEGGWMEGGRVRERETRKRTISKHSYINSNISSASGPYRTQ